MPLSPWKKSSSAPSVPWKDMNAYLHAAQYGDKAVVEEFLDKFGAYVDITNPDHGGWTALMFAAHRGHKEIVELLLENGADISKKSHYGYTAVEYAQLHTPLERKDLATEIAGLLKKWPEIKAQRAKKQAEEERRRWLEETDQSQGLKREMPAPRPFKKGPSP